MIYALGLYFLEMKPGQRVLELGSGSGYGAALLAAMVGAEGGVTSVEVDPLLAGTARTNLVPVGPPPPAKQRWMRFRRENGELLEEQLPVRSQRGRLRGLGAPIREIVRSLARSVVSSS
jgi:protein-L-isoaspartate O-methyltransferase